MTEAVRAVDGKQITTERQGKRKLDELEPGVARHLVLFRPSEQAVENLMARARLSIPNLAATGDVLRVLRYNPDCLFALARKSKFNPDAPSGEGFIAMLPLTDLGLKLLALDMLNTGNPDTRFLVKPGERPAGIYIWGILAPGPLAVGVALFMEKMAAANYAGINLYSKPNTDIGRRFNATLGLVPGAQVGSIEAPHLWVYQREAQRPIYDSFTPESAAEGGIGVTVARTFEDLQRVTAIRGAVYIGEQECPYEEEFDGNDLAATHLLGYVGHEPAGCLRLRYFADFAKLERVAIRAEFRKSRVAFQLARAAFQLSRRKGYTRMYGHAQRRLVNFWSRFGFRVMEGGRNLTFSDFEYVEIVADLERDPEAITIGMGSDPYKTIRPEGRWDVPGILETSSVRPVRAHR